MQQFLSVLSSSAIIPRREPEWEKEVPASLKRRDPRIWQMAYLAASRTLGKTDLKPNSIVIGTGLGALDETKNVLDGVYGEGFSSPRNFIASVHNSIAGKLALEFRITGPNLTMCEGQNSLASAIIAAGLLSDKYFPALVLAIDERIELLDRIHPFMSEKCRRYLSADWEEASVGFLLGKSLHQEGNLIRAFGPVPAAGKDPEEACRKLVKDNAGDSCELMSESDSSYVKPAISVFEWLNSSDQKHVAVCSYSPVSDGAAFVELIKK